tara:strand:+ start:372 stop:578 length:207 start_codon:yes stop_codon:yes gene_type:complete
MIKNKDMNDQLHEIVTQIDLNETEKAYLFKYIEEISSSYENFSKFLSDKSNLAEIIRFLESLTGDKDV